MFAAFTAARAIVGMKPTYGLVSRYGLVAYASSLDQIGPMTKNVEDNAILLSAVSGHDNMDSTSANIEAKDYTKSLIKDVKGLNNFWLAPKIPNAPNTKRIIHINSILLLYFLYKLKGILDIKYIKKYPIIKKTLWLFRYL